MDQRLARICLATWWAAVVLLTANVVTTTSLRYVTNSEAPPPPIIANAFATPFLFIHVVTGVIALVVGLLQFVPRIRMRVPALHRATGRIYVGACAISAPAGFMLALGTTAGSFAGAGFAVQALLLPLFIYLGWRAAVQRRFTEHREWMLRSYALISAAITFRLMLPASVLLDLEFLPSYRAISWLAWMTNLVVVEHHIRRKRVPMASYRTLAAA